MKNAAYQTLFMACIGKKAKLYYLNKKIRHLKTGMYYHSDVMTFHRSCLCFSVLAVADHYEVDAQHGCRVTAPLVFILVPYKPHIPYAIFSSTGHKICWENQGWLANQSGWQPGTISICFNLSIIHLMNKLTLSSCVVGSCFPEKSHLFIFCNSSTNAHFGGGLFVLAFS